jgi:hypothetical protein
MFLCEDRGSFNLPLLLYTTPSDPAPEPTLNNIAFLIMACAMPALWGCANPVTIDTDYFEGTDFSGYETYRWFDDVNPSRTAEYRRYNSSDELIREAANAALRRKGMTLVEDDRAEFLVNYRLSADSKMDMNAYYNQPGLHGGVATGTYGTSVALGVNLGNPGPVYYKEGTVLIDIIDAQTREVVWRGAAEGRLPKPGDMSLDKRNQIIREVVPAILDSFPPQ